MLIKYLPIVIAMMLNSSCSSLWKETSNKVYSEDELYSQAIRALDTENYPSAIKKLKSLESEYPFNKYSDQAHLERIYAYYKNSDLKNTRALAEEFIRLNPGHPNSDYAHYLKALTYFYDRPGPILAHFLPINISKRDISKYLLAYDEFDELLHHFPKSHYALDAKKRISYLRNLLARHELHIAHYYFEKHSYLASANRAKHIIEDFKETSTAPDALVMLADSYENLREADQSVTDVDKVLGLSLEKIGIPEKIFFPKESYALSLGKIDRFVPRPPKSHNPRATLKSNR